MSLTLENPPTVVDNLIDFIRKTYVDNHIDRAVMAVSGGIDSALALTLLSKALTPEQIYPLFLPFGMQATDDSALICQFNHIPSNNINVINIKPMVEGFYATLDFSDDTNEGELGRIRKGNIMARVRMILVYDLAKKLGGLVCGTENKSEKYLGYFTRFGDAASDLEPINTLYKTQVYELAQYLGLPEELILKAPSAGLWEGQTDEAQFGFSYEVADKVMEQLLDNGVAPQEIRLDGVNEEEIKKVLDQIENQKFKHIVPYHI